MTGIERRRFMDEYGGRMHPCPICGKTMFEGYLSQDLCPVCGWQDDVLDPDDPEEETGANEMEAPEYRRAYQAGWLPDWVIQRNRERAAEAGQV